MSQDKKISNMDKNKLKTFLKLCQEKVNPVIKEILLSEVSPEFQEIVGYQISAGGKRLRPALAIISCKLLGGELKDVLYPAAGLEILHNYTLIVDDIIDRSILRRNKPTTWAKYGKSITECIAIDYGAAVFQTAKYSPSPTDSSLISEIFARTIKKIVEGEMMDILFERAGRKEEPYIVKNRPKTITQKQYIDMISKKTAPLFESSCEIGGICAGGAKREVQALKNYGFNLGLAFQVKDDILDIFGKEKEFGKKIGKDIEEKKGGNIVLLLAMQEFTKEKNETIEQIMKKEKITKEEVEEAMHLIQKTNALKKSFELGEEFIKKAKQSLKLLPQNQWNKILENLTDFVIERGK